jgi:hypothetical protein
VVCGQRRDQIGLRAITRGREMLVDFRALLSAIVLSLVMAGAADAQDQIAPGALRPTNGQEFIVTCAGHSGREFADVVGGEVRYKLRCNGFAMMTLNSDGPGTMWEVRLTAPITHCAEVQYEIDGHRTQPLGPGESELVPLRPWSWTRGAHRLSIGAWALPGGCVRDQFLSFGVFAEPAVIPQ